jgi:hypothetical protein
MTGPVLAARPPIRILDPVRERPSRSPVIATLRHPAFIRIMRGPSQLAPNIGQKYARPRTVCRLAI